MIPYSLACCAFMMKSRSTSFSTLSSFWPRVFRQQLVRDLPHAQNFSGMNVDIRRLARQPAHRGLVNQDARIGQREPLFGLSGCQQQRRHGRRLTDADRRHVIFHVLHRVVNCHARCDRSARRVDVKLDVFLRVFLSQEQHLRDHQVGDVVVDRRPDKNDVVAQAAGNKCRRRVRPARSAR